MRWTKNKTDKKQKQMEHVWKWVYLGRTNYYEQNHSWGLLVYLYAERISMNCYVYAVYYYDHKFDI